MSSKLLAMRELECLYWAAQGLSAEQTAKLLGIKATTVHSHRNKAREKLGCLTITQAVYQCVCLGYFSKDSVFAFSEMPDQSDV